MVKTSYLQLSRKNIIATTFFKMLLKYLFCYRMKNSTEKHILTNYKATLKTLVDRI